MKNVTLNNVAAGALSSKITIPNIAFPRGFQDSNSPRLGAEYHYVIGGYPVDARAGVSYETSGVPVNYVSISSARLQQGDADDRREPSTSARGGGSTACSGTYA